MAITGLPLARKSSIAAAAMSLIYFLIILLASWLFYTVMTKDDAER